MASIKENGSLKDYQRFIYEVYGPNNRKHYGVADLLTNTQRFAMRALKGIRKNDSERAALNLILSQNWFLSAMNQLDIDLEERVWRRFPSVCSYCGECPCSCKTKKADKRLAVKIDDSLRPKTLGEFQAMFEKIYPSERRTLEHAGIHLAEEMGELSEAELKFKGSHAEKDFEEVAEEAADLFSCFMGVFNSLKFDLPKRLAERYPKGGHACNETPCTCDYNYAMTLKS